MLLPLAIATNFLGIWLVRVTPTELFYQIAYVLMFLISLELTAQRACIGDVCAAEASASRGRRWLTSAARGGTNDGAMAN